MRLLLIFVFLGIFTVMTIATVNASLVRAVWGNGHLLKDPWFIATLCDAYCGFLTFFVWVAYRERSMVARFLWFVAIMLLGNFAIASYVLIRLLRLEPGQPVSDILLRTPAS